MKLSDRLRTDQPDTNAERKATTEDAQKAAVKKPQAKKRTTSAPPSRKDEWSKTKKRVHEVIVRDLGPVLARRDPDLDLGTEVRGRIDDALHEAGVQATTSQRRKLIAEVTADMLGYGPLEPLLADPDISEVMVNGHTDIFVERNGLIERSDARFADERQLRQIIDRIVAAVGRRVDESSPLCDARLPDGSRVNVILPPLSLGGPALTIRKFPEAPILIDDLIAYGTMSSQLATFLSAAVAGKLNILVSGGTGSGKTTVLNGLSQFVPAHERIVTIEDAAELQLHQPHVVPLEARPANAEGRGEVTIRDLVRNALRMRPDRIIVGEVRGPEALDMLQAMNTGHEGSLTTVHANNPRDALSRIETMVLMAGVDLTLRAIRDQVASALDLILQLDRLGDGRRVVSAVSEVQGMEGDVLVTQDLFAYRFSSGGKESASSKGEVAPTGLRPKVLEKLEQAGVPLPPGMFVTDVPARPRRGGRR